MHAKAGAHRAFGVVLVRHRRTEQGQNAIAQQLVDSTAECGHIVDQPLEGTVDEPLDLLGVAVLGQRGEADDISEQHGHDASLFDLRRRDGVPTGRTEARRGHEFGGTRGTLHQPPSVGQITR